MPDGGQRIRVSWLRNATFHSVFGALVAQAAATNETATGSEEQRGAEMRSEEQQQAETRDREPGRATAG